MFLSVWSPRLEAMSCCRFLQAQVVTPGWVSTKGIPGGRGLAQAVPGRCLPLPHIGAVMGSPPNGLTGAIALIALVLPGLPPLDMYFPASSQKNSVVFKTYQIQKRQTECETKTRMGSFGSRSNFKRPMFFHQLCCVDLQASSRPIRMPA